MNVWILNKDVFHFTVILLIFTKKGREIYLVKEYRRGILRFFTDWWMIKYEKAFEQIW